MIGDLSVFFVVERQPPLRDQLLHDLRNMPHLKLHLAQAWIEIPESAEALGATGDDRVDSLLLKRREIVLGDSPGLFHLVPSPQRCCRSNIPRRAGR